MQEQLEEALGSTTLWRRVVYRPTVGSTNNVAKDMAAQGSPEGTIVLANEQTAGRGRMERRWLAPPGECLLCSLLFRPTLPLPQANRLTMLCAMAAADAIAQATGLQPALKWPNDLVIKSRSTQEQSRDWRKLAGLLTETGMMGEGLDFVIVGLGINVNVAPQRLAGLAPNAASILAETGRTVNRVALLAEMLARIEARYERLRAGENPHNEWAKRLATLGQSVEAITSEGALAGVAESVDEDGALLLRTPDGGLHRLMAGDVTLSSS